MHKDGGFENYHALLRGCGGGGLTYWRLLRTEVLQIVVIDAANFAS